MQHVIGDFEGFPLVKSALSLGWCHIMTPIQGIDLQGELCFFVAF